MQLQCPSCRARYRIDTRGWPTDAADPASGGGTAFRPRKVRCKLCQNVWLAVPEDDLVELDELIMPAQGTSAVSAAWPIVSGAPEPAWVPPPPPGPEPEEAWATAVPDFALAERADERPAFPDEAPPEPEPPADPPAAAPQLQPSPAAARTGPRPRLPGPAAAPPPARMPVEATPDRPDDDDDEEPAAPRRWGRWIAFTLLLVAVALTSMVLSGRIRPEDHGLPPIDREALPAWLQPAALALPAFQLPRTPPPPLEVTAEAIRRPLPDGRTVWEIRGRIHNPTASSQPVPAVELLLLDSAGMSLGRWTVRPDLALLAPGGETRFETSAIDPPPAAVKLRAVLDPAELGRL